MLTHMVVDNEHAPFERWCIVCRKQLFITHRLNAEEVKARASGELVGWVCSPKCRIELRGKEKEYHAKNGR